MTVWDWRREVRRVANLEADDGGKAIIAGNERVLRARLADAKFFWDQDGRRTLSKVPRPQGHGVPRGAWDAIGEKVIGMQALAAEIAERIPDADRDQVRLAACSPRPTWSRIWSVNFRNFKVSWGGITHEMTASPMRSRKRLQTTMRPRVRMMTASDRACLCLCFIGRQDRHAGWLLHHRRKPTGSRDPYALTRPHSADTLVVENKIRLPLPKGDFVQATLPLRGVRRR